MKVTIYGGGNIGTKFATHFAGVGHEVTIFTSKPEKFKHSLAIVNQDVR